MSKSFKPTSFEKLSVGKIMKSSKKRFCWKFELDGMHFTVVLFSSRISGKRSVILEGTKVLSTKTSGMGSVYKIPIPKHRVIINEIGDTQFDLRVDNVSFADNLNSFTINPHNPAGSQNLSKTTKIQVHQSSKSYSAPNSKSEIKDKNEKSSPVTGPINSPKVQNTSIPQVSFLDIFDISQTEQLPKKNQDMPFDLFSTPLAPEVKKNFNPFDEPLGKGGKDKGQWFENDLMSFVESDSGNVKGEHGKEVDKKVNQENEAKNNLESAPVNNLMNNREQYLIGMNMNRNSYGGNMPGMVNQMNMMNHFMTGMMGWNGYYPNSYNK